MHDHKYEPYKIEGPEIVYRCSCGSTKRELREKQVKKTFKEKVKSIFRKGQ